MWSRATTALRWCVAGLLAAAFCSGEEAVVAEPSESEAVEVVGQTFIFEGSLSRITPALAPDLREGLVLSGFVTLDPNAVPADSDVALEMARYDEGPLDAEYVFDVNHVVKEAGHWREGDSWITLQQGDPSQESAQDVYGLTLAMESEVFGVAGWRALWLQLWLTGPAGAWLPNLEPQLPPASLQSAWFRVSYGNADGSKQAYAEGPVTYFGPEGEPLSPTEQIAQLEGIVASLQTQLERTELESVGLREEVRAARARIAGLNSTVDALIEERRLLQGELERRTVEQEADAALLERVAELEAEQVLQEESRAALAKVNEELGHSLAARDAALEMAREEIARLEAALEAAPRGVPILEAPVPNSPLPYLAKGQAQTGPVRETVRPIERPLTPLVTRSSIEAPREREESSFNPRPRKFRR